LGELATRQRAENNRRRNVPAFLEMLEHATQDKPLVRIHFDDIRDKCHNGADVDDDTVEKTTLIPARQAIIRAHLPYKVTKSGLYVIIQKVA
jgi:hypothetical protein